MLLGWSMPTRRRSGKSLSSSNWKRPKRHHKWN
jgi:hypothetical protein